MNNMKTMTHLDMHQDHKLWGSEVGMWLEDSKFWEEEMALLNDDMKVINSAIKGHKEAAKSHKKSVTQHQNFLQKHETNIVFIHESGELDKILAKTHVEEENKHLKLRDAHENQKIPSFDGSSDQSPAKGAGAWNLNQKEE